LSRLELVDANYKSNQAFVSKNEALINRRTQKQVEMDEAVGLRDELTAQITTLTDLIKITNEAATK